MARDFDPAANQRISLATEREFTSSSKLSISALVYPDDFDSFGVIICKRTGGSAAYYLRLDGTTGQIAFGWTNGGSFNTYALTPPAATAGVWQQVGCAFDWASPGSVQLALNGAVTTVNRNLGSGTTPDDPNVVETIGNRFDDAHQFDGKIAEVGAWDRVLTAAEWAVLGTFASPLAVARGLVIYLPLIGRTGTEPELMSHNTGTVTGAGRAEHPRVFYPTARGLGRPNLSGFGLRGEALPVLTPGFVS